MEFQWNSSGVSKEFPVGFLQESCGISMIFLSSSDDK